MPRPLQSTGRPGTAVIPADWSVAPRTVMAGTRRARCTITRPGTGDGVFDPETGQTTPPAATTVLADTGTPNCRVQALAREDARGDAAGQDVTTGDYLVAVAHTVAALVGDVVTVTAAEDATLIGRTMTVALITRGSEQWERDLLCTDDQG